MMEMTCESTVASSAGTDLSWLAQLPRSLVEHPVVDVLLPLFARDNDGLLALLADHLAVDAGALAALVAQLFGGKTGDHHDELGRQLAALLRDREQDIGAAAERLLVAFRTLDELGFPSDERAQQLALYIRCGENLGQVILQLMAASRPRIGLLVEPPSNRRSVDCCACRRRIGLDETRYKCGHCANFDLCEACEPRSLHDPTHVFLKIRSTAQLAQGSLPTDLPMLTNRVRHPRRSAPKKRRPL